MSNKEWSFVVFGNAVAQGRARGTRTGIHYDPPKSRNYKEQVRADAIAAKPPVPVECALNMAIKVFVAIPKSWSNKKQTAAILGHIRPTSRPDLKNFIAGIEDALIGIIYRDDSQIVSYEGCGKWYAANPRVEVRITEIKEDDTGV